MDDLDSLLDFEADLFEEENGKKRSNANYLNFTITY
jgi:hypothetical protein